MKSLKDIRELSLHLTVATLRDAEQISGYSTECDRFWVAEQKFPQFIPSLCTLGKAIETSLITNTKLVVPEVFPVRQGSGLPEFCYQLFSQLFTEAGFPRYILAESRNGEFRLYDNVLNKHDNDWKVAHAASIAVLLLRQICLLFSKAKDLSVLADENTEISDFITRASTKDRIRFHPGLSSVCSVARAILRALLTPDGLVHPSIAQWIDEPFGLHGPGAVAGHEQGREKWNFVVDCLRLPSRLYTDAHCEDIGSWDERQPRFSRLCVVPKDFRGHRLICAEPKELQYAQQGLLRVFTHVLASSRVTNRHISLDDQFPSFDLSRDWRYGTIDLKDASDLLTLRLLKILLPQEIFELVTRFRSDGVVDQDGVIIVPSLGTAFTMGNALCFPFETMVFWSLTAATILTKGGMCLRSSFDDEEALVEQVRKLNIRVYGDDIIVPVKWLDSVTEILSAVGLVVNRQKTCSNSLVRESCGSWWYCGDDCRVTKLKYATTLDLDSWTSFQDVSPELRDNGWVTLADALDDFCDLVYPTRSRLTKLDTWETEGQDDKSRIYRFGWEAILGCRRFPKGTFYDRTAFLRYNSSLQRLEYLRPMSVADDTRALPGELGYLTWFTRSAMRYLNPCAQRTKFRWVEA